jgi:hypothetical protein
MKLTAKLILPLAAIATLVTTTYGGPSNWPQQYPTRVKTEQQARDCCKPGAKVALACKDCKTVAAKSGEDTKGVLAWFKQGSTHDCSGCSGKIAVKQAGGDKGPKIAEVKHVCSKCGSDSAFTCATHAG